MDKRDSNDFLSTRRVCTVGDSSYNTTNSSLIIATSSNCNVIVCNMHFVVTPASSSGHALGCPTEKVEVCKVNPPRCFRVGSP